MSSLPSLDFPNALGSAAVGTDGHGVILQWNAGMEELLGYRLEEIRLCSWCDFLPAADRRGFQSRLELGSVGGAFTYSAKLQTKGHDTVALDLFASPVRHPRTAESHGWLILCTRAAELKAEEPAPRLDPEPACEAHFQAQKTQAIGALAAGLAHDFNNILTAILSHLDLLIFSPDLPACLRDHVVHAKTSGSRAAELVSRLLMFSRQSRPTFAPLQWPSLFDELYLMLRRSIDPKIEVRPLFPPQDLWTVYADASQMMQVVLNLCFNARDAMPEGGVLRFQLQNVVVDEAQLVPPRKAGEFVKLSVADTGKGISRDVLSRLFEPYFTTKEFGKGTGLGLSIAHSIVTEHQGWIEVESAVGKGSCFHVFLPRHSGAPEVPGGTKEWVGDGQGSLEGKETILLVDDEEMVRLVARAVLSYRGYTVVEAVNGEEALATFRADPHRFDLILMDLYMPKMNGWDALDQIRALDPTARVVLVSGGSTEGFAERIGGRGAATVLQKPFDNMDLVRVVRRTLDQARPTAPVPSA